MERPSEFRESSSPCRLPVSAQTNLTGSAQPTRLSFKSVTPNYFAVLGVDAQLGRTFDPHDATPGYNLEVVISDGLWKREFGADPHILGKAVCAWTTTCITLWASCRASFRDQGQTSERAECGAVAGRRICRCAVSAPAARLASAHRDSSRALSLVSRLRPRRDTSMPWLHR